MFDKKCLAVFFAIETRNTEITFFYEENDHDYLTNCFIKILFGILYVAFGNYYNNIFNKNNAEEKITNLPI